MRSTGAALVCFRKADSTRKRAVCLLALDESARMRKRRRLQWWSRKLGTRACADVQQRCHRGAAHFIRSRVELHARSRAPVVAGALLRHVQVLSRGYPTACAGVAVVRARTSPRHTHGARDCDKPRTSAAHAQEHAHARNFMTMSGTVGARARARANVAHTETHTDEHTHRNTHRDTPTNIHTHASAGTRTCTQIHAHTRARAHTHIAQGERARAPPPLPSPSQPRRTIIARFAHFACLRNYSVAELDRVVVLSGRAYLLYEAVR